MLQSLRVCFPGQTEYSAGPACALHEFGCVRCFATCRADAMLCHRPGQRLLGSIGVHAGSRQAFSLKHAFGLCCEARALLEAHMIWFS